LGIKTPAQLCALFRDLGLGTLELDLRSDRITVNRTPPADPLAIAPGGDLGSCELERGLLEGALESISGLPVSLVESQCVSRGDERCRFEAILDDTAGNRRFVGVAPGDAVIDSGPGMPGNNLRTWFLDLASRELARSRRHGRQLSVMYVDLDDLGHINSVHGRAAGDQVIRAVGAALGRGCRQEDFLWHHGEDEFAILLAETGPDGAGIVAKRLSLEVLAAAEYVEIAARISASIGFSTFPVHADSVQSLLDSARSAVYLAKAAGKGRSQMARPGRSEDKGQATARDKQSLRTRTDTVEHGLVRGEADGSETAARRGEAPVDSGDHAGSSADKRAALKAEAAPIASVMIATSSPLLMAGMRQVLSEASGLNVAAEISDLKSLPSRVADTRPDLIFADMEMVMHDDFATLNMIRNQNLPCKLAVFTNDVDQDVIKLAADYQIDGVILQASAAGGVIEALESIFQGRTILPDEVHNAMNELKKNRRLLEELSEREIEVLRLVAEGKSNAQISAELYITVNTVRFHLANIYQKLSVSNRTEAANYYLRQDLPPDGQTRLL